MFGLELFQIGWIDQEYETWWKKDKYKNANIFKKWFWFLVWGTIDLSKCQIFHFTHWNDRLNW